jgi:hypothetical protein
VSRRNREKRQRTVEERRKPYASCVACHEGLRYPEPYVPFAGDHKPGCRCMAHPTMHVRCAEKAHPRYSG